VPRVPAATVNFDILSRRFKDKDVITPIALVREGVVRRISGKIPAVKILAKGKLERKLSFEGVLISEAAKAAIEKAGGTILSGAPKQIPPPVKRKK
jgi:large subunit ribosomal protein L15